MVIALKNVRKQLGIEIPELAEKTGITKTMLWNYEAGRSKPDPQTLCKIADALGCSLDLLVRGKEKDHSEEWSREALINRLNAYSLAELNEIVAYLEYLRYRKEREQAEGRGKEDTR